MEMPTLYHKGKKDKIFSWRCWTEGSIIKTEYGTDDGKKQEAAKEAKPKNVGRSNATTAEEQALLEAKAMWQNKLNRKYRRTVEEASEPLPMPMLAKKFADRKKRVIYPAHVQPKLDGIRCLAQVFSGARELTSRSGQPLTVVSHILDELCELGDEFDHLVPDGELYAHGYSFQTITSWVKKLRPETADVKLHVYDMLSMRALDEAWEDRCTRLSAFFTERRFDHLVLVPTFAADNAEDVVRLHDEFVRAGYEGAIVRMLHGKYHFGYRSNELLKVKILSDDEFEVVSWVVGVGKFKDVPVFKCVMDDGQTFDVAPNGTEAQRKAMLDKADSYIGQMLKVEYFGHYDSGVVRNPVGLGFRMEEDMDDPIS